MKELEFECEYLIHLDYKLLQREKRILEANQFSLIDFFWPSPVISKFVLATDPWNSFSPFDGPGH